LGRDIAVRLAEAGTDVIVTYRSSARDAEATVAEISRHGARGLAVQVDLSDPAQVDVLLERALRFAPEIGLLVGAAGAFRRTPVPDIVEADWDDMRRDNFAAFAVPARRLGAHMKRRGGGCIIALADVAALHPWTDYLPYSIAKSGVLSVARSLAIELAPQVRVNAIAPGPMLPPTDGDMEAYRREIGRTLLQRHGTPTHISDAVLFLARHDYITGTVLPVDGGRCLT